MPLDPVRLEEARQWFARARNDLRAGKLDLTVTPPLCGDACFHAQQAAEKALKGFLCWHLKPVRKTHDIKDIGEDCTAIEPALEPVVRRVAPLSEYAWRYRYPGDDREPTMTESEDVLRKAEELLALVLERLPRELSS
jgi:HEPN domain-containing protein